MHESTNKKSVVRRSESQWRSIVSRFEETALGRKAFCEQEGVASSSLSYWVNRFGGAMGQTPSFVEINPRAEVESYKVELSFPSGLVLRIGG